MAGRNFSGQPNLGEGNGGRSIISSSRRTWISPDEFRRRFESQINATSSDRVHKVAHQHPMYPGTLANQVKEGRRIQSLYNPSPVSFIYATSTVTPLTGGVKEGMRMGGPCYSSSPLFCSLPRTVLRPWRDVPGFPHPAGRSAEDLTLQLMPGSSSSSSSSSSRTLPLTFSNPSGFYFPQRGKMSAGTESENGCDLELRLGTSRANEGESISHSQKNKRLRFITKLLLGQEAEEEGGPKNKKARTDSAGSESAASGSSIGSSSGEEIDLELRLSL